VLHAEISGTDRSFVAEYTQAVADTWEYDSIAVPASPAAGTWIIHRYRIKYKFCKRLWSYFSNGCWSLDCRNFIATANQVNSLDTIGNKFRITLVQLEVGSIASKFEREVFKKNLVFAKDIFKKLMPKELLLELLQEQEVENLLELSEKQEQQVKLFS